MSVIPSDTLAIFNQQGYAAGIEPSQGGARIWPPSGTSTHYLNEVVVNPKGKFGYKNAAGTKIDLDVPTVAFKFTWAEDPEQAAGTKQTGLEWESEPIHILTQAQFQGLPANHQQRVEIAYARLLGSLSALFGRKVSMPELGSLLPKITEAAQNPTAPLAVKVYVKNQPNKKDSKYQDQECQIREVVSGAIA